MYNAPQIVWGVIQKVTPQFYWGYFLYVLQLHLSSEKNKNEHFEGRRREERTARFRNSVSAEIFSDCLFSEQKAAMQFRFMGSVCLCGKRFSFCGKTGF